MGHTSRFLNPMTPGGLLMQGASQVTFTELQILQQLAAITYAAGDVLYFNGTAIVKLAIGSPSQVLTVSGGIPQWSSASGITVLTATGTVDGSNVSFTFVSKPTFIISDTTLYRENHGWTWNGGTLTATMSVPPRYDIFGF